MNHRYTPSLRTALFLLIGLATAAARPATAQIIEVSLPRLNTTAQTVAVPVLISSAVGLDVTGFTFTLLYDETVIRIDSVLTDGYLTDNFVIAQNPTSGRIVVAGAGAQPLGAGDSLLALEVEFLTDGSSLLVFESFSFGEGTPYVLVTNGAVSNINAASSEDPALGPDAFALHTNYPNPFENETTIVLDLGVAATVAVDVHDLLGRRVKDVPARFLSSGRHQLTLDTASLAAGTYICRVAATASNRTTVRTLTLTRLD